MSAANRKAQDNQVTSLRTSFGTSRSSATATTEEWATTAAHLIGNKKGPGLDLAN
jgi:hypothetical protein